MFYKSDEIKKEVKQKIDIVHNGKNAKELITDVIKYSNVTLVIAPKEKQDEFIIEFNSHKGKNGRMKKSVYEIEDKSIDLNNYILIHKEDYENFLKFQKKNIKAISEEQQKEIKQIYKSGISQRKLADKFGVSVATINKIIKEKY